MPSTAAKLGENALDLIRFRLPGRLGVVEHQEHGCRAQRRQYPLGRPVVGGEAQRPGDGVVDADGVAHLLHRHEQAAIAETGRAALVA